MTTSLHAPRAGLSAVRWLDGRCARRCVGGLRWSRRSVRAVWFVPSCGRERL